MWDYHFYQCSKSLESTILYIINSNYCIRPNQKQLQDLSTVFYCLCSHDTTNLQSTAPCSPRHQAGQHFVGEVLYQKPSKDSQQRNDIVHFRSRYDLLKNLPRRPWRKIEVMGYIRCKTACLLIINNYFIINGPIT